MGALTTAPHAQKKEKSVTGFAITAAEKGGRSWKEVKMVDINTGEELRSVYQSTREIDALNARTGKPVLKKDGGSLPGIEVKVKKVINLDQELANFSSTTPNVQVRKVMTASKVQTDKPFATNSAAMAYDKKHERLYYTPMGINQLRYIDLKAKEPKVYYFEDEPFGIVRGSGDAPSQITRMVIASDGDGYALTNDGNHLIRFTTGKKPAITDLGTLTDDDSNGNYSVHSSSGYGGDMIADASKNLYLITANRNVFKINIESKVAAYKGTIKGLPRGFSTNGAMVDEGSKVIVASSESTVGYFRFDLNTMQAEKVSGESNVYNASDLANGNLAFSKKKDKKEEAAKNDPPVVTEEVATQQNRGTGSYKTDGITVYPNPVTSGLVRLSFSEIPVGRYQVQLIGLDGKLISSKEVNINSERQVEEFRLPDLIPSGNYLIKVYNEATKVNVANKIVVQ
jgi:hypothetical protein